MVLGWKIDTHLFLIHLPENRCIARCNDIDQILLVKQITQKHLHKIKGHLDHAAYLIPTMRHSLSRIRALRIICKKQNKKIAYLPQPVVDDLILCQQFLCWAKNGISINLISSSKLSVCMRSDACEYGLGGYNIYTGCAWRIKFPSTYTG